MEGHMIPHVVFVALQRGVALHLPWWRMGVVFQMS